MEKKKAIVGPAILVMIVVLASKVLGFIRQTVIAAVYGSNVDTDIYFMSSDFMIGLSGALIGSLTTALVTIYIDTKVKQNKEKANQIASQMLSMFLLSSVIFIVAVNIFAPFIAKLLAPTYTGETLGKLVMYLRMFSITFIFTSFQSIYAAVLNANDSFVPGKLYGIVFNPLAIIAVLLFAGKFGMIPLIVAYVIANLLQTLLLKHLCKKNFEFKFTAGFSDASVKHLIILAVPLLVSNIFLQLNAIVDKSICSTLGEGFASYYLYANTLEQFITTTITTTVSLLLLSKYATYVAEGDTKKVILSFKESISGLMILLAPITAIVCALAYEIVSIVYRRGEFTDIDAQYTSKALIGFAIGFCIIAVREMYIRLHFSYQDTKMPMIASIVGVVVNAVLSIILAQFMGIFGVSFATSVSAILTIAMLNKSLKKYIPEFKFSSMKKMMMKVLIASLLAFETVFIIKDFIQANLLIKFSLCALMAFVSYIACLEAIDCAEFTGFLKNMKSAVLAKLKGSA